MTASITPLPPEPWGVPEYARLVVRFLDAHGIDRVTVVGHSNGGRIALFMATEPGMSERLHRLVLISPSGVRPLPSDTRSREGVWRQGDSRDLILRKVRGARRISNRCAAGSAGRIE